MICWIAGAWNGEGSGGRLTAEGMNDEGMIEERSSAVVALSERAGENAAAEGTSASIERMRGVESPSSAEGGMELVTEGGFEERLGRLVALEESLGAAGRILARASRLEQNPRRLGRQLRQ